MKKHISILTILFLFMVSPTIIFAMCTNEEKAEFNKVAEDYKITYNFNNNSKSYDVTFYKPHEKFSVLIASSNFTDCTGVQNGKFECYNVPSGEYIVEIIGNTNTCDDTLKTMNLTLPKYNEYSADELCKGIEEFVLCQPTYDKEIDYDSFVSRVNIYRKTKDATSANNKKTKKNDSKVVEYIEDNMFEIIIVAVFIVLVAATAIIMIKSYKKSRRLE